MALPTGSATASSTVFLSVASRINCLNLFGSLPI
jgi:hypothetical protein